MYWYKVKTLLIWLFAAINIFLLVFIVQGKVRQNLYEKKEIQSLVEVLAINGIEVEESLLSEKRDVADTASVENLISADEEMAKIILGENYAVIQDESGLKKYVSNGKSIYVNNGKLFYKDENLKEEQSIGEEKVDLASQLLKNYNIDTSAALGEIKDNEIVYTYYYDNFPLFENTLRVKMSGEKICSIEGYIIGFNEQDKDRVQLSAPTKVLVDFLRDERRSAEWRKVVSIEFGYSVLLADTSVNFKLAETIPTYKIKTDKNEVYYYDARR